MQKEFKSLNKLTWSVVILSLMSLSLIGMTVLEQIIWRNYYPMASSDQMFSISSNYAIINFYAVLFYLNFIGTLGTPIIFFWWIYRANKNLHFFGAKSIFSPRMSVIWFFVPIIGIWKGYQVIKQIWKVSNPEVILKIGDEWKHQATSLKIVKVWWISQLVFLLFNPALRGLMGGKGSISFMEFYSVFSYSDTLLILSALFVTMSLLLLVPTITGIKLIRQVSKWQDLKVKENITTLGSKE